MRYSLLRFLDNFDSKIIKITIIIIISLFAKTEKRSNAINNVPNQIARAQSRYFFNWKLKWREENMRNWDRGVMWVRGQTKAEGGGAAAA